MSIVVTGSIANDYLMQFPGRIREQLVEGQLDHISLSFLVDELQIYRGGIGANIAFGLGQLGHTPYVVGAVGPDFAEYREWLERHGVNTTYVHVSEKRHTARFLCTTDADHNQIASFYAGAMAEAKEIDLTQVVSAIGDVDLVMIGPDEPLAMLRHTQACRALGIAFVADPSQQLARMDGAQIRELVDGARWLFTNEYERDLLARKTGWTQAEVLDRVGGWIVTLGDKGLHLHVKGEATVHVPAHGGLSAVDPTGVGDACRSGFIAALECGFDTQLAAQVGCTLASFVLESAGTQEYRFLPREFLGRVERTYGANSAAAITALFVDAVASTGSGSE